MAELYPVEQVAPSQRAREYAWEARPGAFRDHNEATREKWMAGQYDGTRVVQTFARFEAEHLTRIEATPAVDPVKQSLTTEATRIAELEDALAGLILMIWIAQGDTGAAEKVERARDILLKSGTLEPPPSEQRGR